MAVTSVKQPFPPFGDVDGNPLESGYIYIGTINLDPVTNPISVYWDAALSVPAAQPIRTIGGYPSNNGTPGALFASDEYSITIKNKNLTLVATAPTPTVEISVATSTKIGGVKSGGGISVDPVGAVTIVNDSHTHDTQYYPKADIDSLRRLYAKEAVTHNITINSDYTLTSNQNLYGRIIITDTGVVLTSTVNIIADTSERDFYFQNDTAQVLIIKTLSGTGVSVQPGLAALILCDGTNIFYPITSSSPGVLSINNLVNVQEQQATTVSGGDATAGVQTRVLNTVKTNNISGVSLAANQIVGLPAGDYYVEADAPMSRVAGHQAYLYDITGAAIISSTLSSSEHSSTTASNTTTAKIRGIFSLSVTSTIEVRHFAETTRLTDGLGTRSASGNTEIYTDVKLWKVG